MTCQPKSLKSRSFIQKYNAVYFPRVEKSCRSSSGITWYVTFIHRLHSPAVTFSLTTHIEVNEQNQTNPLNVGQAVNKWRGGVLGLRKRKPTKICTRCFIMEDKNVKKKNGFHSSYMYTKKTRHSRVQRENKGQDRKLRSSHLLPTIKTRSDEFHCNRKIF